MNAHYSLLRSRNLRNDQLAAGSPTKTALTLEILKSSAHIRFAPVPVLLSSPFGVSSHGAYIGSFGVTPSAPKRCRKNKSSKMLDGGL